MSYFVIPASTDPREWSEWPARSRPASTIRPAKGEFVETVRTRQDAGRVEGASHERP